MAIAPIPNKNTQFREYPVIADETWVEGALLTLVAGELDELTGADPTGIAGFAAHDVPMEPVDVYDGSAKIYAAYPGSTFWMSGSRAPLATDEGVDYGLDYSSGIPIVDLSDTTNERVYVEGVDLVRGLYEVSIIGAHRQIQPTVEA